MTTRSTGTTTGALSIDIGSLSRTAGAALMISVIVQQQAARSEAPGAEAFCFG
jgi:hypothetical protein